MKENITYDKSVEFSVRIINLYKYLINEKKEKILSAQILRSGTSIGANIAESDYAITKNDFINKTHIAIKEANETKYWLELLLRTNYITSNEFDSINNQCIEIIKILSSILNTSKKKLII